VRARYIAAWIVLACVIAASSSSGAGDAGAGEQSEQVITSSTASGRTERESIRYQRIMVPVDRPEDWPREKGVRYLPMPAGEFDRRIRQLGDAGSAPQSAARSQFIRAEYSARLRGDAFVDGEAKWEFKHSGQPEVLVLGQCQLPLSDFQWTSSSLTNESSAAHQTERSALQGDARAIVGDDETGRLAAKVDRAGTMRGRWSLAGTHESDRVLTFAMRLPKCSVNVLRLTLPAGLELAANQGQLSVPAGETQGERTWLVQLGGQHDVKLKILPRVEAADSSRTVRESHQCTITERGLELSSELQIMTDGPATTRFSLTVESPLKVVELRWNDVRLNVEDARSTGNGDNANPSGLTINLPTDARGPGVLKVQAIAPWQLEARSRLPLVHLASARWEQGRARLLIPHRLELRQLLLRDCHQTST
jgi:hypothetical protein